MNKTQQAVHDAMANVLNELVKIDWDQACQNWRNRANAATLVTFANFSAIEGNAVVSCMEKHGLNFNAWKEQHDKN